MNYQEAMDYIYGASGKGKKLGLDNMRVLLHRLGDPQESLKMLHVAGTNGKGSICSCMESVLRRAGYKTGLYTSPHLERFNDRMRVCGHPVSDEKLAEITEIVAEQAEKLRAEGVYPTFFEITTAIAFTLFAREKVDYAVIEVGLGGRFDSTNVITPLISVIASIGLDHMKMLGDTVEKIAFEKAGIIKPGVPAVIAPQKPSVAQVFYDKCAETGSKLVDLAKAKIELLGTPARGICFSLKTDEVSFARVETGLPGDHQAENLSCAIAALDILRKNGKVALTDAQILEGVRMARWPGRLEWIEGKPDIILDGAHNGPGARTLLEYVRKYIPAGRHVVLLSAILGDKPVEDVVRNLAYIAPEAIITGIDYTRSMDPQKYAVLYEANSVSCRVVPHIPEALEAARALAGENGVVVVSGSLYLVGEVRALLAPDDGSLC